LDCFVTGMMAIVPGIGRFSSVSSFKGVTETYLALTWALVFVTVVILILRRWPLDRRRRIPTSGRWLVFWLLALNFVAICIGQFIGMLVTAKSLSGYSLSARLLRSISTSRSALALYGTALYALQSILITSAVVVGRNFRRLWLTSQSVRASE
jgi:ABC-type iron transport system FetAB permease component